MCFLFVFFSKRKQYYPLQRNLFKLSKSKVQQFTAIVVSPNGQGVGASSSAYYTLAFTNSFIFIYFVFNSEMKPYNIFLTTILVAACVFIFIKIFKFCLFVWIEGALASGVHACAQQPPQLRLVCVATHGARARICISNTCNCCACLSPAHTVSYEFCYLIALFIAGKQQQQQRAWQLCIGTAWAYHARSAAPANLAYLVFYLFSV